MQYPCLVKLQKRVNISWILAITMAILLTFVVTAPAADYVPSGSVSPFVWEPLDEKWVNGLPKGYREGEVSAMVVQITNEALQTYKVDICIQVIETQSGLDYFAFTGFEPWDTIYDPNFLPTPGPIVDYGDGNWDQSHDFIWGYDANIISVTQAVFGQGQCNENYLGVTVEFNVHTDNAYILYGGRISAPGFPLPEPYLEVPVGRSASKIMGSFQSRIGGGGEKTINFKGQDIIPLPDIVLSKTITLVGDECPGQYEISVPEGTEIKYCFEVRNNGNVILNDVMLDDPMLGGPIPLEGLTPEGDLLIGATATAEVINTVYGSAINTATATGNSGQEQVMDIDSSSVVVYAIDIDVSKKVSASHDGPWQDGPIDVLVGNPVYWQFTVTNFTSAPVDITLADYLDGAPVSLVEKCPDLPSELASNETYICTFEDTSSEGLHTNTLSAVGCDKSLPEACDEENDSASYTGVVVEIDIQKTTNGEECPDIRVGEAVTWKYEVKNIGSVPLSNITVTDDQGVVVSCPQDNLVVGESMICNANGSAGLDFYENIGTATGNYGNFFTDANDPSCYTGVRVEIDIQKTTNGEECPDLRVGEAVTWEYEVTNKGTVPLSNITVTDNQGVTVGCPQTTLGPGDSMTCHASGFAVEGSYGNIGTAMGYYGDFSDEASNQSCYTGVLVEIDIRKTTNGEECPDIYVGEAVTWEYVVTNIGTVPLSDITVTDDQGVTVECPQNTLGVGESMTCHAYGTAVEGSYGNTGTAMGYYGAYSDEASDQSCYYGFYLGIDIEKMTNGENCPTLFVDDPVTWTYNVCNQSNIGIGITVEDSEGVTVICPKNTLEIDECITCSAQGIAIAGDYSNIGTVKGYHAGAEVQDEDSSCYFGLDHKIRIDKQISDDGLTWSDSITVLVGSDIWYRFVIMNTGNVPLSDIRLVDSNFQLYIDENLDCLIESLEPGEQRECLIGPFLAEFTGKDGPFENTATVTGCYKICVSDDDSASYRGLYWAFTPGFWKNHTPKTKNGHNAWQYTAFETDWTLSDLFVLPDCADNVMSKFEGITLLKALRLRGGTGIVGAARILFRSAVASLFFHEETNGDIYGPGSIVYFPYYSDSNQCLRRNSDVEFCQKTNIIDLVNGVLLSCDRDTMLELANHFDDINNRIHKIEWNDVKVKPKRPVK
jgi:hypothetical protein